jgi:hypothetical protein
VEKFRRSWILLQNSPKNAESTPFDERLMILKFGANQFVESSKKKKG